MIHAAVGVKAGHRAPFKRMALAVGLTGKMTATVPTPELADKLAELIDEIGPYPHSALDASRSGRARQGTRMLKVTCPDCGCIVRMTQKWIDDAGAPICGACVTAMVAS
jgi:hypothetical protein